MTPSGQFSTLYAFTGYYPDGYLPVAGLVIDQQGNLYGTTLEGGTTGCGTIFEVSGTGKETILYNFGSADDGCSPMAGLVMDSQGNFYGTTYVVGTGFYGDVFKFVPSSGTVTTLYSFTGGSDGCYPWGVVLGNDGNLYGTTQGGCTDTYGVVFKVTPSGTETVLHSFTENGKDGFYPQASVILDSEGNIYGTTQWGGKVGVGTVYKITPSSGKETILHSFAGGADGFFPQSSLIFDGNGNL